MDEKETLKEIDPSKEKLIREFIKTIDKQTKDLFFEDNSFNIGEMITSLTMILRYIIHRCLGVHCFISKGVSRDDYIKTIKELINNYIDEHNNYINKQEK